MSGSLLLNVGECLNTMEVLVSFNYFQVSRLCISFISTNSSHRLIHLYERQWLASGSRMVANIDCIHQVLSSMGHHHMDLNDFTTAHSPFPTGLDQVFHEQLRQKVNVVARFALDRLWRVCVMHLECRKQIMVLASSVSVFAMCRFYFLFLYY